MPRCHISIHPPARGGTESLIHDIDGLLEFQSTHPQGVGLLHPKLLKRLDMNFNPPTRKGWDAEKGAFAYVIAYFNPPTRKGWDCAGADGRPALAISIHPPARGGTTKTSSTQRRQNNFNPPTRKGWDLLSMPLLMQQHRFQSTHPQGVGRHSCHAKHRPYVFQSTHPQGVGLDVELQVIGVPEISIHPPARGGTVIMSLPAPYTGFQSTHPQGVGPGVQHRNAPLDIISIHPPARGGTFISSVMPDPFKRFQSTHPQGVGR